MEKFIRITGVMEQTGLAKSTIWAWVKKEQLPKPLKLSSTVTVWKQSDLNRWIEERQVQEV